MDIGTERVPDEDPRIANNTRTKDAALKTMEDSERVLPQAKWQHPPLLPTRVPRRCSRGRERGRVPAGRTGDG